MLKTTLIAQVMSSPVISVHEADEFHVVEEKFSLHDIRHLPVVDNHGILAGLITQRDLYKIHSPRRLEDGTWYYDKEMLDGFILKNTMRKDLFTLRRTNTLEEAIRPIVQFKFGCIPVVDEKGRPTGIITRDNVLKFFLNTP